MHSLHVFLLLFMAQHAGAMENGRDLPCDDSPCTGIQQGIQIFTLDGRKVFSREEETYPQEAALAELRDLGLFSSTTSLTIVCKEGLEKTGDLSCDESPYGIIQQRG